jgi:hypothetical protein
MEQFVLSFFLSKMIFECEPNFGVKLSQQDRYVEHKQTALT